MQTIGVVKESLMRGRPPRSAPWTLTVPRSPLWPGALLSAAAQVTGRDRAARREAWGLQRRVWIVCSWALL